MIVIKPSQCRFNRSK